VVLMVKCPWCKGTGKYPKDEECVECDGTGEVGRNYQP